VLGSSSNGSNPAQAALDEFYSFADQLPWEDLHYFEYLSLLGPVITNEQPEQQQPKAERGALVRQSSGFRGPLVGSFSCGTNTSVWFTNLVVTNIVGQGATFSFSVAGGTNGVAYSLYRSVNVGAPFISTNWQWLQYVHACDSVQLTNQGPTEFYLLAGEKDSDGDGMPDSWEVLHQLNPNDPGDALADPDNDGVNNLGEYLLGTDPRNPDSDYDGICDGAELLDGTNPLDPESVSSVC